MAAVVRSAARRVAGPMLPRAPATGSLGQRTKSTGALVVRPPSSAIQGNPQQPGVTYICVEKKMACSMLKAAEELEMLKFKSDLSRLGLYQGWSGLNIYKTKSKAVDLTSLPKILRSVKDSLKPHDSDVNFIWPVVSVVMIIGWTLPSSEIAEIKVVKRQLKGLWADFVASVTEHVPKEPKQDDAKA